MAIMIGVGEGLAGKALATGDELGAGVALGTPDAMGTGDPTGWLPTPAGAWQAARERAASPLASTKVEARSRQAMGLPQNGQAGSQALTWRRHEGQHGSGIPAPSF
jgi:hypothetical protein